MNVTVFNKRNDLIAWRDLIFRVLYHIVFVLSSFYFFNNQHYIISLILLIPHFIVFSFFGLAGIGHELFHNSVFSSIKTNKIVFKICCLITWNNYAFFSQTHWKHHIKTLASDDPKSLFKGSLNFIQLIELSTFDFTSFLYKLKYTFQNSVNIIPNKFEETLFKPASQERLNVIKVARMILLFHASCFVILLYFKLLYFFFTINLGVFFLSFFNKILGYAQHYGLTNENNSNNNYFTNCRTIILPRFWSFFYANMNYHVEHHIYPTAPYYNLQKIHKLLIESNTFPNISRGWFELFIELRRCGLFRNMSLKK